jgi:hypothetical protein
MRKAFAGLALLLFVLVVAQFYFAAAGAGSTGSREAAYRPHHALGYVIFIVPVVMMAVAALGRMPGRLIWMPALVSALTSLQVVIAEQGKSLDGAARSVVFGLHAFNGLAILLLSGLILRKALVLSKSATGTGAATTGLTAAGTAREASSTTDDAAANSSDVAVASQEPVAANGSAT